MTRHWIGHRRASAPLGGPFTATEPAELLDRASALAGIGAWECDLPTETLNWTSGVFNLFGIPQGSKIDRRDIVGMYCDESREAMEWLRAEAIARHRGFTLDAEISRMDGERRWMRLTADVICHDGRPAQLYGLKQDITEERARWEAMRKLAEQDALTGLSNRGVFHNRFLHAPRSAPALSPLGALVLIDAAGLKQINDTHGHAAGDACLEAVATRLSAGFSDALLVARIEGARFAVLASAQRPIKGLEQRIGRLLRQLGAPIFWHGQLLALSPSAGIALAGSPFAYDAEAMFDAADAALLTARQANAAATNSHASTAHFHFA